MFLEYLILSELNMTLMLLQFGLKIAWVLNWKPFNQFSTSTTLALGSYSVWAGLGIQFEELPIEYQKKIYLKRYKQAIFNPNYTNIRVLFSLDGIRYLLRGTSNTVLGRLVDYELGLAWNPLKIHSWILASLSSSTCIYFFPPYNNYDLLSL